MKVDFLKKVNKIVKIMVRFFKGKGKVIKINMRNEKEGYYFRRSRE